MRWRSSSRAGVSGTSRSALRVACCAISDRRSAILAAVIVAAVLAACSTGEPPVYEEQAYVFGTLVEIKIAGESEGRARELAGEVFREFGRLHNQLHAWKPGPLKNINEAFARGETAPVDPETAGIIRDATRYAEQSGELFDPAIGALIELWGFHADEFTARLPDAAAIGKLVAARPLMTDIALDDGRVASRNPAVQLDFGGYAKGYALDLAERMLRAKGVRSALINIGGNILAIGSRGERPWRVGIQHPRKPSAIATLDLRDGEAVGTSGDYQRYFLVDGRRYCHIIDPRTGKPADGVQAATVVVPRGPQAGTLSDVATKPIFIAGVADWREAARRMGIEQALLIDEQGVVYLTSALAKRLDILDKNVTVRQLP
jgi:FAD:protein FMN transferase